MSQAIVNRLIENSIIEHLMKTEAINFAKFITNDVTFNNFVFMSKEAQEEIYQEFKKVYE